MNRLGKMSMILLRIISIFYIVIGVVALLAPKILVNLGVLPIYAYLAVLFMLYLVVFPEIIVANALSLDGKSCSHYDLSLLTTICDSMNSGYMIYGLAILAIVLGVIGFISTRLIKEGNIYGHYVWRGLIVLAVLFSIFNIIIYTLNTSSDRDGLGVFTLTSILWTILYYILYRIYSSKVKNGS